jgi:hypothetical protein
MDNFHLILLCQFYLPIIITIICNYYIGNLNDPILGVLHILIILLTTLVVNNIIDK